MSLSRVLIRFSNPYLVPVLTDNMSLSEKWASPCASVKLLSHGVAVANDSESVVCATASAETAALVSYFDTRCTVACGASMNVGNVHGDGGVRPTVLVQI